MNGRLGTVPEIHDMHSWTSTLENNTSYIVACYFSREKALLNTLCLESCAIYSSDLRCLCVLSLEHS